MLNAPFFRSLARPIRLVCATFATAASALFAQSPSANDGFDPNVDGNVYARATQPDGKIIVAGQFTAFRANGATVASTRNNIARLNGDGTVDVNFDPNANGPIRVVVLQPDGKILISGDFTTLQPGSAGTAIVRIHVARLNANGSVDTTFDPNITGSLQPQVFAIALQSNGSVVVGGNFTAVQPAGETTSTPRRNLARFT